MSEIWSIFYFFFCLNTFVLFSLTSGGIPTVFPVTVAHHTIKYENAAIQRMLPRNVIGKNFFAEIKYSIIVLFSQKLFSNKCAYCKNCF